MIYVSVSKARWNCCLVFHMLLIVYTMAVYVSVVLWRIVDSWFFDRDEEKERAMHRLRVPQWSHFRSDDVFKGQRLSYGSLEAVPRKCIFTQRTAEWNVFRSRQVWLQPLSAVISKRANIDPASCKIQKATNTSAVCLKIRLLVCD